MDLIQDLLKNGFDVYKKEKKEWYYVCKKGYRGVVIIDLSKKQPLFDVACKIANIVHFRKYNITLSNINAEAIEKMLQHKFKDCAELNGPREVLNNGFLKLTQIKKVENV